MKRLFLPFVISAVVIITIFYFFKDLETSITELLIHCSNNTYTFTFISFSVLLVDIILPIPSSIVMYLNGYILGTLTGSLVSLASLSIGALIGYYIGKLSSYGLRAKEDQHTKEIISKYGVLAIIITRGIPVISESICFVYGYHKMPIKHYFLFNLIGYTPLCLLYAYFGKVGYDKNTFLLSFGFSLLMAALLWLIGKKILVNRDIS
jgi:uncharacterized membrane protein YdjX (TVP38/TMEM64 family)